MSASDDDETAWYWLKQIYELLAAPNFLLDWIVPIATTALAVAAIYLAYRSFRTAKESNDQSARFRREDQEERDLRWRRTFAVDLRDWYRRDYLNALFEAPHDPGESKRFSKLIRATDLAGQDSAKRLARWLAAQAAEKRSEVQTMTPKARALARHPSRMGVPKPHLDLVNEWVKHPDSATPTLDAFDAQRQAEQIAMLKRFEAMRERLATKTPTEPDGSVTPAKPKNPKKPRSVQDSLQSDGF